MKTPRRLLLNRHRQAEPALDAIREGVVRELSRQDERAAPEARPTVANWLGIFWQELFVSCRRYWMGLGTAWCGILLIGLFGAGETFTRAPSPAAVQAVQEQLLLRAELLTGAPEPDLRAVSAEPAPQPRSSLRSRLVTV